MRKHTSAGATAGFTLIEVLITVFVLAVGLLAHSMEQLAEPQVIRPRGRYIGPRSLPAG